MQVTVLGSINVDTILPVAALPGPGETVLAGDSARLPGGKGANQAVAAARMGAETAMIGAVGGDADGDWMAGLLAADGIDIAAVHRIEGTATGAATIAVDRGGENLIIVAPGANGRLAPEHVPMLGNGPLLAQLEVPVATIAAAFSRAEGLRIVNAAPAVAEARSLFAECDLLIVNEHELAFYAGGSDEAAARSLIARDGQAVVVTLGAAGSLAVWADRALHVPAWPVTPVDTVGAGDCFCGALAALLAEGRALEAALPLANAAAALCTQAAGAVPAMPVRAAVEALARGATYHASAIKTPNPVVLD